MVNNILTCKGFESATERIAGYLTTGDCMKSRIGLVILFFIIAALRKWGGEEAGLEFSFLMAIVLGLGGYFVVITFFASFKIAMIIGLVLSVIGGYGGAAFFGGDL